jgi:hypothetical protein
MNNDQLFSKEELEALIAAVSHASVSSNAALQPTTEALENLASKQEAVQARIIGLEKSINQLHLEVEYLKERDSEHNNWLKDCFHWKRNAWLGGVVVVAIAALVINQNIALANLRSNMLDQFIRMERKVAEGPIKKTKK